MSFSCYSECFLRFSLLVGWLVVMVTMLLALCSLPWSAGPGCSSSWPMWTRRDSCSSMFMVGIAGFNAPRAVFSSLVRRPMMLGVMAGMDLKLSTMAGVGIATGAAKRRRKRRLRSWLRHERMTVAMTLAEVTHHTAPRGQKTARARGEERDVLYYAKGLMTPPPTRPTPLVEGRPQGRVLRHVVEDLGELAPLVQILDLLVPQMVDYVADALRVLDFPLAEQVIEVPKMSCASCPSRSPVPEPQSAEQLVEVPTVLSPTRIALQIAEQIVDTPVPRGRGQRRVQGFLPRQSSTATPSAEERISERIVEQSVFPSSAKRTSERIVEQLVDTSPGGGLAQGSASSAGPADEDFAGVFRTFPRGKKVRVPPRVRVRSFPGRSAHGLRRLMWRPVVRRSGLRTSRARASTGTDVLVCPPGSLLRASRSSGSGRWMRRGTSITGTRKHVSVRMSFLLFLLSEELHRQPRAVYKC